MDLGDILSIAAKRDMAKIGRGNDPVYEESINGGNFCIKLSSKFEEAYLECSIPYTGLEEEKNYLRTHFLSMVFNSAIYGMKRLKNRKDKKI